MLVETSGCFFSHKSFDMKWLIMIANVKKNIENNNPILEEY